MTWTESCFSHESRNLGTAQLELIRYSIDKGNVSDCNHRTRACFFKSRVLSASEASEVWTLGCTIQHPSTRFPCDRPESIPLACSSFLTILSGRNKLSPLAWERKRNCSVHTENESRACPHPALLLSVSETTNSTNSLNAHC